MSLGHLISTCLDLSVVRAFHRTPLVHSKTQHTNTHLSHLCPKKTQRSELCGGGYIGRRGHWSRAMPWPGTNDPRRATWLAPVGQGVIGPGQSHGPGPMTRTGPGPMSLATGPGPMAQAVDPGGVIGLGSVCARDQWLKPLTLFLLVAHGGKPKCRQRCDEVWPMV